MAREDQDLQPHRLIISDWKHRRIFANHKSKMLLLTPLEMYEIGLKVAGFSISNSNRTNMIRFMDTYGAHPETLVAILNDLQSATTPEARIDNPDLVHFLLTFDWLSSYQTYYSLSLSLSLYRLPLI